MCMTFVFLEVDKTPKNDEKVKYVDPCSPQRHHPDNVSVLYFSGEKMIKKLLIMNHFSCRFQRLIMKYK